MPYGSKRRNGHKVYSCPIEMCIRDRGTVCGGRNMEAMVCYGPLFGKCEHAGRLAKSPDNGKGWREIDVAKNVAS